MRPPKDLKFGHFTLLFYDVKQIRQNEKTHMWGVQHKQKSLFFSCHMIKVLTLLFEGWKADSNFKPQQRLKIRPPSGVENHTLLDHFH